MDFSISSELEDLRNKTKIFVRKHCIPLESPRDSFDEHEHIPLQELEVLREKAKAAGLWAPQMPQELGGMGLKMAEQAVIYEEANFSIFGPAALNCSAPDDGNMRLLLMVGTDFPTDSVRHLGAGEAYRRKFKGALSAHELNS